MINWLNKIFKKNNLVSQNTPEEIFNDMFNDVYLDIVSIQLGDDFKLFKNVIIDCITEERQILFDETGFIFPLVHVTTDENIQENEFYVKIYDKVVYNEFVIPTESEITADIKKACHYIYENHLEQIFTNEILEKYIESLRINNAWLIWNITSTIPLPTIKLILLRLLKQGKSIKNLPQIFDKIGDTLLKDGFQCPYKYTTNQILKALDKEL